MTLAKHDVQFQCGGVPIPMVPGARVLGDQLNATGQPDPTLANPRFQMATRRLQRVAKTPGGLQRRAQIAACVATSVALHGLEHQDPDEQHAKEYNQALRKAICGKHQQVWISMDVVYSLAVHGHRLCWQWIRTLRCITMLVKQIRRSPKVRAWAADVIAKAQASTDDPTFTQQWQGPISRSLQQLAKLGWRWECDSDFVLETDDSYRWT